MANIEFHRVGDSYSKEFIKDGSPHGKIEKSIPLTSPKEKEIIIEEVNKLAQAGVIRSNYRLPQDKLPFGNDINWQLLWEKNLDSPQEFQTSIMAISSTHLASIIFLNEIRVLDDFFDDPANLPIVSIVPIGFGEENFVEGSLNSPLAFPSLLDTVILRQ
uniref:Uncharacterized protein n=1 Tax=Romanomermis culicivorax TaxID=13658 RepID=A0A915KCQ9_ROMCU